MGTSKLLANLKKNAGVDSDGEERVFLRSLYAGDRINKDSHVKEVEVTCGSSLFFKRSLCLYLKIFQLLVIKCHL